MKMHTHTAAVRRTARVSQHFIFPRTLFSTITFFLLMYLFYFIFGIKYMNTYKPPAFYPHWKKKQLPTKQPLACGIPVKNEPIIKVRNLETYMVSSYAEHREQVKMLRIIAIVLRSETTEYGCLICCNGTVISVSANCNIHSDHFGFKYGTADITCQIPKTCPAPSHVAITSRSSKEDGSMQNIYTFQPVRNQKEREDFAYEFTVCISTMFDYENVLILVQAMEMFKILGVQKVAIYKTSCHPVTQKILDYYIKQNFVEIIPWHITSYINVSRGWQRSVSPGDLHYFGQIAALNDCVYRYMYQSRYIALQDLDEFILPMKEKSWRELIPILEQNYDQEVGFEFENNVFPLSIKHPTSDYSPDSWKKVMGINILEHVYRLSNDPTTFNAFKVIVNPRLVFRTTVHGFLDSKKGSVRVNNNIARMYHLRNMTNNDVLTHSHIRDTHLRDYADRLIPAVNKVLRKALDIY